MISATRDDISRGLMTWEIWKKPCINLFITYFVNADNMLLPFTRGQITCYCPRKMVLPRRQIIRRKLCFYYTCKFGVISIKYVTILFIVGFIFQFIHSCIHSYLYVLLIEIGIWTYKKKYYKIYQIHHINVSVNITFSAHDAFLE